MSEQDHPAYCGQCGSPVQTGDRFCGTCGATVLPPAPQAEQVISEPVAAAQGATLRSNRRALFVAGAVGVLLLVLVGGGAIALLGSGEEERSNPSGDQPEEAVGAPEGLEEPTTPVSAPPLQVTTTSEPSTTSPEATTSEVPVSGSEAVEQVRFAAEQYYLAVDQEDWKYTYYNLDSQSKALFTEEEWSRRNQWYADNEGLELDSIDVDVTMDPGGEEAEVTIHRTFEDGSSITRNTFFVWEGIWWKHHLTEEEKEIFRPDLSYEEFDEAQQGSSETSPGEVAAVENAVRGHYEAIGEGDFEEAYSYFGPTLRSRTEEEIWIEEEESYGITSSTIHSVEVEEVSGSTATATVDVSFEDNTGTPRFEITWKLLKEGEEWKLEQL